MAAQHICVERVYVATQRVRGHGLPKTEPCLDLRRPSEEESSAWLRGCGSFDEALRSYRPGVQAHLWQPRTSRACKGPGLKKLVRGPVLDIHFCTSMNLKALVAWFALGKSMSKKIHSSGTRML